MDAPGAVEAPGNDRDQEQDRVPPNPKRLQHLNNSHSSTNDNDRDEQEKQDQDQNENQEGAEDDDEDEEHRLKYVYLTKLMPSIYRGGDATSTFIAAGDKLIVGTHNGNIHAFSLPLFQSLLVYRAHSASVTSISISPFPPPLPILGTGNRNKLPTDGDNIRSESPVGSLRSFRQSRGEKSRSDLLPAPVASLNLIYIATSSIDGNVCIASLTDPKDVLLRNFGRPVQAVALSPAYKSDRTYLSGGRAGQLILTVGGRVGASSNSTTMGGAAAAASSWLGSIGLGTNSGKDTVLHSGEGAINTIKWSLSGKYVTWVNEEGIKIMRSHLHLESSDSELAWTRISHVDRPNRPGWEEMAGVWKARVEWMDESSLESADDTILHPGSSQLRDPQTPRTTQKVEKLVVGWGSTVWVINVFPDRLTPGRNPRDRRLGCAEVVTILRTDCIVSGVSLYTPNLLLVLVHIEAEPIETESTGLSPSRSRHRKRALEPELRFVDIETKEEISADTLSVSRYDSLSSSDYHMSVLPAPRIIVPSTQRGTLGVLGNSFLDATLYPARLFSSSASVRSSTSSEDKGSGKAPGSFAAGQIRSRESLSKDIQAAAGTAGVKIFIQSPYDCVLAVKRDLADRLSWLESHARYKDAWMLIDEHPEAVSSSLPERPDSAAEVPRKAPSTLADFFADDSSSVTTIRETSNSIATKEKRRIGERWLEQLVSQNEWQKASEVCGKVLDATPRWEHWIWTFIKNNKTDEITPYIPVNIYPRLSSLVYEVILGHYVSRDRLNFKELLEKWPFDLFDISSVTSAIEEQLKLQIDAPGSQDWEILMDSLAKLLMTDGRYREALRCYIRLQDAEAALGLVRDYRLLDAVSDDIPGFILLRVSKEHMKSAPISELEAVTNEPIQILVREAYHGIVRPEAVVTQLKAANRYLFLYFYLRSLWRGESHPSETDRPRLQVRGRYAKDAVEKLAADEGRTLVEPFADTAVELFAEYDRPLLMEFLQSSTAYLFDAACTICEVRHYAPELIYLLSKTGQTRKALNLILSELKDISQAISFAKSQDDPDLWEDLLNYSMDKSQFIHALLAEAGTAVDPIKLVRRIPSGLEIEGLRDGLTRMIREHDIQASISQGAARVLQGEVAIGMDMLRKGQRRGIKFDIIQDHERHMGQTPERGTDNQTNGHQAEVRKDKSQSPEPGRCGGCHEPFHLNEKEILVGFACGHVFHISHLEPQGASKSFTEDDATERLSLLSRVGTTDEPTHAISRTVGPKVTTARLIRDKVKEGCRICALN